MRTTDYKRLTAIAVAGAGLLFSGQSMDAASVNRAHWARVMTSHTALPVREFRGDRPWQFATTELNERLSRSGRRNAAVDAPVKEFENLKYYDFLNGPDGNTWFYTTEYEVEREQVSDWYTEERILAYTFTIYDASFNKVGTVKDKVTLAEGETKVAHAVLDPTISRKFFNSDEKPEVMVYLAMNTSADLGYEVNYYNKIYSIGGETDADGNSVCLGVMEGRCIDTFNAGDEENENFFFTFAEDYYPDFSDDSIGTDYEDFLAAINSAKTVVTIYQSAGNEDEPRLIFTKDVFLTRYPGDTTDGIYMITKSVDGTPYFIFSEYEKPYFLDPTGFAADENATPDNNLLILPYRFDGEMTQLSVTKIPVEIREVEGQVAYTFYSIGSVAWGNDIDMKVNGTTQAPAYIVALDFTTAANLDEVSSSYRVYGNDGKMIHAIAEETDGIAVLNSAAGDQPHAMLVTLDDNDAYIFHFVDLYDGVKTFTLNQANGGDPLTAVCERVVGEDGKYKYVFEMQNVEIDDEDNILKRIAWYNGDGTLDRIDKINLGKDVQYAVINMYPECLSPTLFDEDAAMEYAVLAKRFNGTTTANEFMVVDDNGELYARFSGDEGKGLPYVFSILTGKEGNCLQMVYNDDDNYNIDIYELPFLTPSAVENIFTDKEGSLANGAFDGENIVSDGAVIAVYNTEGVLVAKGNGAVSLRNFPRGIYIAVATDSEGRRSTLKISY